MANRTFNQFPKALEKEAVSLYAKINIGAAGAPSLVAGSCKGIASIARTATGKYTLTFQDTYNRILSFKALWDETGNSGTAPLAPLVFVFSQSVNSPAMAGSLVFVTGNYTNGAATDAASGEILRLEIVLSNSTAY